MFSRIIHKQNLSKIVIAVLFVVYSFFFWLTDLAFLAIKQDYVHLWHYRLAFFIHVFSAILVLLAGYTQFSASIRRRFPTIHRRAGWFYVLVTLLLEGPSGFLIGIYANGGLSSQIAFCLLAVLWILFTAIALLKIIRKEVMAHRAWMIRSFALALSAITLRAWKYLLKN